VPFAPPVVAAKASSGAEGNLGGSYSQWMIYMQVSKIFNGFWRCFVSEVTMLRVIVLDFWDMLEQS
jgi:hypothetical protein